MFDLSLIPGAFIAGILMFLAPCTLPIVPGYLAFIGGTQRANVVRNAIFFVLGFAIVFIILGLFAGAIGVLLGPYRDIISRLAGAILVLFGLTILGVRIPVISREVHIMMPTWLSVGRPESSLLIGMLFAFGWSPCIGPILGTVLLLASQSATAFEGALLLGVFSLGLGLPFIATAFALEKASAFFQKITVISSAFTYVGAFFLIFVGALILTDKMALFTNIGLQMFDGFYRLLLPYM